RLISMKSRNGIQFMVDAESIHDPQKKSALKQIQSQLASAYASGHRISKVTVTQLGHVVYVFNNEAFFAGYAPEGAEGFIFQDSQERVMPTGRVILKRLPTCPGK